MAKYLLFSIPSHYMDEQSPPTLTVHTALHLYLKERTMRGLSPRTLSSYQNSLRIIIATYPEGKAQPIDALTIADIRHGIMERMNDKPYAAATINHTLAYLRGTLRHVKGEQGLAYDTEYNLLDRSKIIDSRDVHDVRMQRPTPDILTDEECEQLILEAECNTRDHALLLMMLTTGMRRGEVLSIELGSIEWDRKRIRITGKGSKERYVFLSPETITALTKYMRSRNMVANSALSTNNATNKLFPIKAARLYQIVKKYAERCGFAKVITPHTLRHTFATMAVRRTNNIEGVRKMMGHEYLATTQQYLHLSDDDAQNIYNSAFTEPVVKPLIT